jgi:AI-2 transport protein TqsA
MSMDNTVIRVASVLIIAFLVIGAFYFADVVFEPVAFALFAISIVWPLQQTLRTKLPRGLALIITFLLALVVVITLTSMVAWGGGQIAQSLTQNFDRLQSHYLASVKWFEAHDIFIPAIIAEHFNMFWLLRMFQEITTRLNSLIGFLLLTFIFMAMGLLEGEAFANNLQSIGGQINRARLVAAGLKIGKKFRRYMLVRSLASLLTGLIIWGFALGIGLELAAAWGVISFALNYIPFIGPLIATLLPTLFALAQTGSWEMAVLVLITLTIVQILIGSYLEPLFTAKTLAISSFIVVFSVFFWGFIWGLPGTFIGVPIAIACLTICEQYPESRWIAVLLSGQAPKRKIDGV